MTRPTEPHEGGVTVVTGAGSGIGAAVVAGLLAQGHRVAAIDLDVKRLGDHASAHGPAISLHVVDVTDEPAMRGVVTAIEGVHGPVVGLVNAAGVLATGSLCDETTTRATLRHALAVNVEGVWSACRAVVPGMIARRRGSIVTVASNAATTPRIGLGAYCASKAAASMLTRCFGLELARHGVRCNVVSPGSTDTPMLQRMLAGGDPEGLVRGDPSAFRLGIPLGRIASPGDVAEAVLFLLSPRARHVTLQEIVIDGGATL